MTTATILMMDYYKAVGYTHRNRDHSFGSNPDAPACHSFEEKVLSLESALDRHWDICMCLYVLYAPGSAGNISLFHISKGTERHK